MAAFPQLGPAVDGKPDVSLLRALRPGLRDRCPASGLVCGSLRTEAVDVDWEKHFVVERFLVRAPK